MSEVAQPGIMEEVIVKVEDSGTQPCGSPTGEDIEQKVNNEVPVEPVKMKKPRAKPKAAAVAITKEDMMEA
eukprot:443665-Heterocapsa_arctica.AAC.1